MSSSTTNEQLKNYHDVALKLVKNCGPLMLEGYSKAEATFETKSAFYDLVTEYDQQIEDALISGLKAEFPESKFLGEESSAANNVLVDLTDSPTWIIDPIDGTNNFVTRIPHCAISVALAVNKELVVGIVYNPMANEMYSAWKGNGAYLNGKLIKVTEKCTTIKRAVVGLEISLLCFPNNRERKLKRLYKLTSTSNGSRSFGCAALALCYVAKGCLQCYHVEDLKPWDVAGGTVILREAGGVVTHTSGTEFNVMQPDLIGASTVELLKEVAVLIKEADDMTECEFK